MRVEKIAKPLVFLWLVLCLAGCTGQVPQEQPLRIGLRSIVGSMDPLSESTIASGTIYYNIFDTLVRRDRNMVLHPSLATGWSTPDELTWVFDLRRNAQFSDGSPLTAEDVRASIERLKSARAQQSAALAMLDRIDILDDHKVRIVTTYPSSTLLVRLADVLIFRQPSEPDKPILGSGPYMVKEWQPGKYVHLITNPHYWGEKPAVQAVNVELQSDAASAARAILNKQLDIFPQMDRDSIEKLGLQNQKEIAVKSDPGLMVLFLAFQTNRDTLSGGLSSGNPFRDRRVREAVARAVNVNLLIDQIQKGDAVAATQLVAPMVYGFDKTISRLPYDPAAARQLLAQAGYPQGFDVRLDTTNNRYRNDVEVGKAIAADLAAVGIRVHLNSKPLKDWLETRQKGESPFYLAGWSCPSGDASGALDYILHTPDAARGYGSANSGGYSDPALDRVIEQCGQTMDPKARLELLQSAMRLAMTDVAYVPLYIEQNLTVSRSDLVWEPCPDQVIIMNTIRRK